MTGDLQSCINLFLFVPNETMNSSILNCNMHLFIYLNVCLNPKKENIYLCFSDPFDDIRVLLNLLKNIQLL